MDSKHPDHQNRWERYKASDSALTASLMAPPSLKAPTVTVVEDRDHDEMGGGGGGDGRLVILTAGFSGAIKIWAY